MNLFEFRKYINDKKIMCFGTGNQGRRMAYYLYDWGLAPNTIAFIDNDKSKWGTRIECDEMSIPICSIGEVKKYIDANTVIIITSLHFKEIYKQIHDVGISDLAEIIAFDKVSEEQLMCSDYPSIVKKYDKPIIPKIIHYVWVGCEMPKNVKDNIRRWKEICSDYEFIRWDESNYDISSNRYMQQAYMSGRWGFVPDVMRLNVIYKYGGIYLDTDIEMVKKPDELLYQEAFGCVDASFTMNHGSGFGSVKGNPMIQEMRDYYDDIDFVRADGSIDDTSCNTHMYRILRKYGYQINDRLQKIKEINIYPMIIQGACHFTKSTYITDKTFWIHHGNLSWMN